MKVVPSLTAFPETLRRLRAAIASEHPEDPRWIIDLFDDDEPPLNCYQRQTECLRDIPKRERSPMLLSIALEYLTAIGKLASEPSMASRYYYACITISDILDFNSGLLVVPCIAIYVDPVRRGEGFSLVPPHSPAGLAVERWIAHIGPQQSAQFVVGEEEDRDLTDVLHRIYVGFRTEPSENLRSVAYSISQGPAHKKRDD